MDNNTTQKPTSQPAQSGGEGSSHIDPAIVSLLDLLDEQQEKPSVERRKEIRITYRRGHMRLRVTHPGGGSVERVVIGRAISAHGAGVLYEGFLHPGTKFHLTLNRWMGGQDTVRGKVRHCKHVHGTTHLVGLEFESVIVPKLYVDPAVWAGLNTKTETNADPATMRGFVLMLDDQKIDHAVAAHCLRGTSVKLKAVASSADALDCVRADDIDAVLCDLNLGNGERGEQAIVKLRESGYRGPIVVVSAEGNPERIAAAWAAGATAMIPKPYTRQTFLNTLAGALATTDTGETREPLYSTLLDQSQNGTPDQDAVEFVKQYVGQVQEMVGKLKQYIRDDDLHHVRMLAQTLKGSGTSYGFVAITDVATQAIRALDGSGAISEALTELRRLEVTCGRLNAKAWSSK